MPLGMIQGTELPTWQDSCLARIATVISKISLAAMALRLHHLETGVTGHLQNISALTSPTTLFPISPMMSILALCNINDVKVHGPIILCLCMHHLSSFSTSITSYAPGKLHSLVVATSCNKYSKIYVNDQIVK